MSEEEKEVEAIRDSLPVLPYDAIIMSEEQQQLAYACMHDARMRINDHDLYARISQIMRLLTGRY